jgi:hypothetical protein
LKPLIISLIAVNALAGCAVQGGADRGGVGAPIAAAATVDRSKPLEPSGYASTAIGENRYEITYAGPWSGSRDSIEGGLLYRAALLASQHGKTWFRFLHMPGEAGPLSHPGRGAPSFGAAYGHWQPHWSYLTESGWQPWHPEWGAPFWAETLAGPAAERVEVHAMIELGSGSLAVRSQTDFDVAQVLRDLRPRQN